MNYLILGGSGFIGTHLIHLLKEECVRPGDKIYDLDIVMPGEEGVVPGTVKKIEGVEYVRADVREKIELAFQPTEDDIIFNLAAVHRTPGHEDREYFETNILGAENVTEFAERYGIRRILFTSSIAPYGAAEELKEETTLPTPNTPYGISKLVAEKIHEKWQNGDAEHRELVILRPGVVYGKGEHGNFTRLYQGLRGRYFFYVGRKDTIKACIYVKELVRFMLFLLCDHRSVGVRLYNCTYEPAYRIDEICGAMMEAGGFHRDVPLVPAWILLGAASVLGPLGGKRFGIHPERVRKLMISTNISGKKMAESGYRFRYPFEQSLGDWLQDEGWARMKRRARTRMESGKGNGRPSIRIVAAGSAPRGTRGGEPVRVAQMMTDMEYGGVEMVVMNYYRHIDRGRFQFDFFALEGSSVPMREEIERLGGRVYMVPRYTRPWEYEKRVEELLVQNGYGIVHSHMNALSVLPLRAAKKAGVPVRIAHSHSTAGKGETGKNIAKYALRPLAGVYPTEKCACSAHAGEWLFGRNAEFRVFHNAIDIGEFAYDAEKRALARRELGLEGKLVVGHVGRFCWQKNHGFLLDIFNELAKRRRDAVLLLAGEGELLPDMKRKARALGLGGQVKFLGPRRDACRLYQAMDVFVLPSRYEGLPVVAVEAQAAGLPCVLSDRVPREAKVLDSTIFVGLEASARRWASEILGAASGGARSDASAELRAAGFDIEVEARKLESFYESLLARGGAANNS